MGTRRREPGRPRWALLPHFEAMEVRCTPTNLPTGFTEAAVATGLSRPTAMEFAPDGRLFVLEQAGNVELVRPDGTTSTALHLNVDSQGERGLLGIAFDPAFASNHFVYLYYTNPGAGGAPWATGEHNQLSRFTVDDSDLTRPIFKNEAPILDWDNLSAASNHNGGAIHFGSGGMLYADAGDNAQTFTQGGRTYRVSQTLSDLLGKQLRIDVGAFNRGVATRDDTMVGHLIPADNPFVGTATGINQLIYALGLRNPYTFAVQPATGTIFINDVGENTWEEIDQSVAGANFGWSGGNTDGFGHSSPPGAGVYHDPLLAYNHSGGPAGGGIAIVGGTFYDPTAPQFPASYVGKYFYADLGAGWIRVFDPAHPGSASNPDTSSPFASGITGNLIDLKVDQAGNLYYLTGSGTVERVSFQAPRILTQPVGQSVSEGQSATFTVGASGPSLSYEWQHLVGARWEDVGTNSPAYTIAAATTAEAGGYRVTVANPAGSVVSDTVELTVNPTRPVTLVSGLNAEFFDFTTRLRAMPTLAGRVADLTRTDTVIDYPPTRQPWAGLDGRFRDTFAVRETGLLEVSTPGRYRLSLRSKDGARLWLDGALIISNGGIHPLRQRTKALTLKAGLHTVRVEFFANTGLAGLVLSWSGPGLARQVVPANRLFHTNPPVRVQFL
jgi:glucose/arabinose dehydrogenase